MGEQQKARDPSKTAKDPLLPLLPRRPLDRRVLLHCERVESVLADGREGGLRKGLVLDDGGQARRLGGAGGGTGRRSEAMSRGELQGDEHKNSQDALALLGGQLLLALAARGALLARNRRVLLCLFGPRTAERLVSLVVILRHVERRLDRRQDRLDLLEGRDEVVLWPGGPPDSAIVRFRVRRRRSVQLWNAQDIEMSICELSKARKCSRALSRSSFRLL